MLGPWLVRHATYNHIYGWLRKVSGRGIMDLVSRYEDQQRWSPERRSEHTLKRIQDLLQHAWDHVPIWREKLDAIGAEPGDIRTWEDFARIPVMKREDLRDRMDECLADNVPPDRRILCKSSGSSGVRVGFWSDRDRDPLHYANVHFNHRWMGVEVGEREIFLWADVGIPRGRASWPKRLQMRMLNRMVFATHRLDEEMLTLFHRRLQRFRPKLITAFPTYLALYVRTCRERGWPLHQPKAILSTGETLVDDNRRLFEETFEAPLFNRYGSIELGDIAHECEAHEGLHINTHRLWVEVLPIEGLESEDGLGAIVVTDLDNRGVPLIRYEPGDLGSLWPAGSTHDCPCGRTLPRMKGVMGRHTEILRGASGRAYPQMCFGYIPRQRVPGVLGSQTVHRPPRAIVTRLHVGEGFPEDGAERYRRVVEEHTNGEFDITIEVTDNLQRTPTGKLRNLIIEKPE